jgi:WD40 repeat protein/serine/threonine protein kinase
MNPRLHQAKDVFLNALEKASDSEREAYLDTACAGDADLRHEVEELLGHHKQMGSFLQARTGEQRATLDFPPAGERPGTVIGTYTLLERIGEGGMGTVYLAQQHEPVQRKVALKLIKPGMDSLQVIARFEAERQALALMDHPNIARVFDGGTTLDGRPYFVMELVQGVAIVRYCDQHRLTLRERLELMVSVCQAVQHAHQKGVIHRDLKPSNVLIALYDDRPVVKVIDFGVAKATGRRLTDETLETGFGAIVGTLEYMAPEQAEVNPLDIDTRSDIYSLGVLLYELLTGSTPLDRRRLQGAGLLEVLRVIREEEPPRPSTRLNATEELPTIAANRGLEPEKLSGLVRGELDWIVMKCLDRDRNRRYETANALAQDLERHLRDEPVLACPPSTRYRLRKFMRRNKRALFTASLLGVMLLTAVGALAVSDLWVRDALRERNQAFEALTGEKQKTDEALKGETRARTDLAGALANLQAEQQETKRALYSHLVALADREWRDGNVKQAEQWLAECPAEYRRWEWHCLKRLCHTDLGTVDLPMNLEVLGMAAFSPDATRVAFATGYERFLNVWDVRTGRELADHRTCRGVESLSFSPDGKHLAVISGAPKAVRVLDVLTGQVVLELAREEPRPNGGRPVRTPPAPYKVVFSGDGKLMAVIDVVGIVRVCDVRTGKVVFSTAEDTRRASNRLVGSTAFSADGKYLAIALGAVNEPGTVDVWDTSTARRVGTLTHHTGQMRSVAFSPNGKLLASAGMDRTIKVWPMPASDRAVWTFLGHTGDVSCLAFSPDGEHLASGSADQTVRFWSLQTGREVRTLRGHAGPVRSLAFSENGQQLTTLGDDRTVKIWDARESRNPLSVFVGAGAVRALGWSSDGQRIIAVGEQGVKAWEPSPRAEPSLLCNFTAPPSDAVVNTRGGYVAVAQRGLLLVESGSGRVVMRILADAVGPMAFSPEGNSFAAVLLFMDKQKQVLVQRGVTLWDTATGRERFAFPSEAGRRVSRLIFSSDGKQLLTFSDVKEVKVRDAETGAELSVLQRPRYPLAVLAVSPDGKHVAYATLAAGAHGEIWLWDMTTGREVVRFRGHRWLVTALAFSRDGHRLASASGDASVRIWDTASGRELLTLQGNTNKVSCLAFSPDGHRLASTDELGYVKVWDATPWEENPAGPAPASKTPPSGKDAPNE